MTNDRERFLRFMRAMNTIDGEYAALMHGLRVKESLFVLLYACLDDAPRSQKEICDEWRMPRSTLNTQHRGAGRNQSGECDSRPLRA